MDAQELTEHIQRYSGLVYRIAFCYLRNQADADDILQDVFLELFTYNKTFHDEEHIRAWLIRVTVNKCKNLLNSFRYRMSLPIESAENIPSEQEPQNDLLPIILRLPPKYRIVMYMFYYEDQPVAKIAQMLDIKPSAVTTRLSRGRNLLKELLIKEGHDEF